MEDHSLQHLDAGWNRELPASDAIIQALVVSSGLSLPEDYLALLRVSNGGEGRLGAKPGWFQVWPAQEVVTLNKDYLISEFLPGFFAFGSSGGGNMLAFDTRTSPPWKIYTIDFIGMEEEYAILVAEDFTQFVLAIGQDEPAI